MASSPTESASWIMGFADLASSLSDIGVTTHTLEAHWGSFGSWILIARRSHEAVRFTFDGRDSFMTVEASPIRENSAPDEWDQLTVKALDNRGNESLEFCEKFLRDRYAQ